MALTDILRSAYRTAQNIVRPAVLGLALAYCGPTVDDEREGCRDDNDCRNGRVCEYDLESGERYCVGSNENYSSRSLCENACRTLRDCCNIITGNEKVDCEENDWNEAYCRQEGGASCMDLCVEDCENETDFLNLDLKCLAELECVSSFHDIYQCAK